MGIATIYAGLEELDLAFEWFEKAYEEREPYFVYIGVDPLYESLRSDPRFQDLLRRMNLPE